MIQKKAIEGLYAICDNSVSTQRSHFEIARALLKGGISNIQLRMKGEKDFSRVLRVAREILSLKMEYSFNFILNDYVSLAAELEVDGVHIGKDDLALAQAKKVLPPHCLIGYSAHSLNEVLEAQRQGADLIAFGAIFPTATKGPGHPIQGLEKLRSVVEACQSPVVAIGGIGRKNFHSVVSTGVAAIAMISALVLAEDIARESQWFVEAWKNRNEN